MEDSFSFLSSSNSSMPVIITGRDLAFEINQLETRDVDTVVVREPFDERTLGDLNFLKGYHHIKKIWVTLAPGHEIDCSGIYNLGGLEEIGGDIASGFDYSRFPALKSLRVSWWKGFPDLSRNTELKHLMLRSFNPKSRSLTELSLPDDIAFFELDFSNISDLTGLPAGVVDLELAYCRNLQGLRGLERSRQTLRSFIVQNCRALSDYGALEECLKLEKIILDKCGELPSVGWTEQLEELKHFTFADTHVADGNLDPLFRIPYVYFTNASDYNHRMKDFDSYH